MNKDKIEVKWEELKGQVKEKWGKFTEDDIASIQGRKDQLLGKLRERYSYTANQADRELGEFMNDCNCTCDSQSKTKDEQNI